MKRLFFLCHLLVHLSAVCQQKQAAVWAYGSGCYLDFNISPLTNQYRMAGGPTGVSAVCDSTGKYQFQASSQNVRNRNFKNMPHGTINLSFNNMAGGQLIIPHPDSAHLYLLFLNLEHGITSYLKRAILTTRTVNMRLDSGRGDVDSTTIKNTFSYVADHLACMLHANGRDSWVVGHVFNSDSLFALLVTKDGIIDTVYTDTGSPVKIPNYLPPFTTRGYDCPLKSSPDSRYLFVPRRTLEYPFNELYRFDRESGKFSNRLLIKDTVIDSGLFPNAFPDGAFSPDSRLLYTATGFRRSVNDNTDGPGFFWQYSLDNYDSTSIENSKIYLGKIDRFDPLKPEIYPYSPRFQLAMDGKIYISHGTDRDTLLSIIQCPNTRGLQCQLQIRSFNLHPTFPLPIGNNVRAGSFFPTLNQTFVRNAGIFQLQANKRSLCQGDTLELSGYGAGAEHFTWSVNPALPSSVKVDTLTWQRFSTKNIVPGSYAFSCKASSRCGDVYEKSMVVEVNPLPEKPVLSTLQKPVPCAGDTVLIAVQNVQPSYLYQWNTGSQTSSIKISQTGNYFLDSVVTDKGCVRKGSDTISLSFLTQAVPSAPVLLSASVLEICEGKTVTLKAKSTENIVWNSGFEGDSVSVGQAGSYFAISKTQEGCTSGPTDSIRVEVFEYPVPQFVNVDSALSLHNLQNRNYCVSGFPGSTFSFSVQNGAAIDSSEDCITVNWAVPPPLGVGGPVVRWRIAVTETRVEAGCRGSSSQTLTYFPDLKIPTLITPNNDGHNDTFVIEDLSFYSNHRLQIFNRWGKRVLDSSAYKQDWNEEQGIYFYRLVVDGKEINGWILVEK